MSERGPSASLVPMGDRGIQIRTVADAIAFSVLWVESGMAPPGETKASAFMKVQAGSELGFAPMQSLQVLHVSEKGRLAMAAVGMLALIRRSPLCALADVFIEGDGEKRVAVFVSQRHGQKEKRVTYSVDDAKAARLWNKKTKNGFDTPWVTAQDDMLIARAITRGSKRNWPDVIYGIESDEVMADVDAPEPQPPQVRQQDIQTASAPGDLPAIDADPLFEQAGDTVTLGGTPVDRAQLEREAAERELLEAEAAERD